MKIYKILIILSLNLHNLAYRLSGKFGHKLEGGPHPKHRLMRYHQFFIDNISNGDRVLDIGCGRGELDFDVAKKAKEVIGIDIKERNIKIAREKYSAPNLEYIVGDATKYYSNVGLTKSHIKQFDVIILSNVLEHIDERVEFLNNIKKLAPKMLIRVPMINRDWITLYKKDLGVRWKLDVSHYIEYTMESFRDEIERAGLKIGSHSVQFGEIWAVVN
jgi:2-polyprenyl-3-methyl-5-hydroxy-6-metoxy-1,4-benzoquinol methylase